MNHRQVFDLGGGDEVEGRFRDHPKRPFRTDDQARQVGSVAVTQKIEVVSGDIAESTRITCGDLLGILLHKLCKGSINAPLQAGPFAAQTPFIRVKAVKRGGGGIAEDDVGVDDVVGRHAVEDGMGAGGIVAHHAANGGAIGAGGVGSVHQAVRLQGSIESPERDPWLRTHRLRRRIYFQNLVHVAREVEDKCMANGLACQTAAAAAW